jgi:tetratricopeptide (TPR) repeat protein
MIEVLAWLETHKKQVAIGAVIVVLGVLAVMLVIQQQARKELAASEALSNVRAPFGTAGSPAGTIDGLSRVVSEHAGTGAAARALLVSAGLLFSEAKSAADYAEAEKRFQQLIRDYPDSPWLPQAHLGVAASLAAQGKTAEATAKYEEINRRFATAPIYDQSRLALARLYESTKPEEAIKIYDELTKAAQGMMQGMPNSATAMEAVMREDDLLKAKPELAKVKAALNPPPAPPPSAVTPPVQITPLTNTAAQVMTNLQRMTITNRPGTAQPVQIKLNQPVPGAQTPSPGAANPAPAPAK